MSSPEHSPNTNGPTPLEENPFEYELFVGHDRTDGTSKSQDQLLSEYVKLTDDLISKITKGVSVTDPETGVKSVERPDYVVWLDKSARPVYWLTKELWPLLAPESEGDEVPKMPKTAFVNIDREQWVNDLDPNGSGYVDITRVSPQIIRSLRSIFVETKRKSAELNDEIDTTPAMLDGKTVLIVDEVRSSGRTLDIATKFFQEAFPTAKVATAYWMSEMATKSVKGGGSATGNRDLPVWYRENDVRGRGVGNRDERISRHSPSVTQRLGSWFLSTRLSEEDVITPQIRKEISHLADDLIDGNILYVPGDNREIDEYEERAVRLNHGITFEEYKNAKHKLGEVSLTNIIR